MSATRRDVLKFAGGTAVGALFTPIPWRLVTDAALWSENWPGIPRPARGELHNRFTHCSLCGAGCAVRARCIGDHPIALAGAQGGLCPFGLAGHHLPYHPARLRQGPVEQATAAVAAAVAGCGPAERVAVLDLRPGRAASWVYRRAMAAVKGGMYLAPRQAPVAFNLANARTVLSLGIPLIDGWGTPAKVFAARDHFRLIQAEAVESRTADLADQWLPIRPGSEEALARGIAGVLKPGDTSAADAARATGLAEQEIVSLARELAANGPAAVVGDEQSPAALGLNLMLGGWGTTVFPRHEAPVPEAWNHAVAASDLEAVPDRSIRVLLIDESAPGEYLPWPAIERKLVRDNPVVVAFACSRLGYGRHAQFVLPTAVYPEGLDEVPPAVDSPAATFRLATSLVPAPQGVVNPPAFVSAAAGLPGSDPLRERADAIHKAGRGTLVTYADGKSQAVKELAADEFWKALNEGGSWVGEVERSGAAKIEIKPAPAGIPVVLEGLPLTVVLAEQRAASLVSPLLSKLYQESNLRLAPNRVALHPADARATGVEEGARAMLETRGGRCEVEVTLDASVPLGVVEVPARPGIQDLCAAGARARVVAA